MVRNLLTALFMTILFWVTVAGVVWYVKSSQHICKLTYPDGTVLTWRAYGADTCPLMAEFLE